MAQPAGIKLDNRTNAVLQMSRRRIEEAMRRKEDIAGILEKEKAEVEKQVAEFEDVAGRAGAVARVWVEMIERSIAATGVMAEFEVLAQSMLLAAAGTILEAQRRRRRNSMLLGGLLAVATAAGAIGIVRSIR